MRKLRDFTLNTWMWVPACVLTMGALWAYQAGWEDGSLDLAGSGFL